MYKDTVNSAISSSGSKSPPLDTSAQNDTKACAGDCKGGDSNLKKRAKRKGQTNRITELLLEVEGSSSTLGRYYARAFSCARVVHEKDGKRTATYCNSRHCLVCNSIRTAKLIQAYGPAIEDFKDPQFVTLTVPNPYTYSDLTATIEAMKRAFSDIAKGLRVRNERGKGDRLHGVRRLEVTYKGNGYHPHFHAIVEGEEVAQRIKEEWLRKFPDADEKAQDIRPATEGSEKELFKYNAKATESDTQEMDPVRLNAVLHALYSRRTVEAYGSLRGIQVSEDVDEVQAEEDETIPENTDRMFVWSAENEDWFCLHTGESLLELEREALERLTKTDQKHALCVDME